MTVPFTIMQNSRLCPTGVDWLLFYVSTVVLLVTTLSQIGEARNNITVHYCVLVMVSKAAFVVFRNRNRKRMYICNVCVCQLNMDMPVILMYTSQSVRTQYTCCSEEPLSVQNNANVPVVFAQVNIHDLQESYLEYISGTNFVFANLFPMFVRIAMLHQK